MIKLAYGLQMLDDMSLAEFENCAKIVSEIGYDGLEPSVCSPTTLPKEEIKAILDRYNLKFSGLRSGGLYDRQGARFSNPDPAERQRAVRLMKEMIDLCGYFGCDLNFGRVQGWIPEGESIETGKKYIAECVAECSDYCAQYNINFLYHGGFVRLSHVLSLTRLVQSVFLYTWLRLSTSLSEFHVSYYRSLAVNQLQKKLQRQWELQ